MAGLITEELNLKLQLTNKKNCKFNKLNLKQMKTIKPKLILTFCVLMALTLAFTSCKKNREFRNETASVTEDNKNVQAEMDGAVDDANKAISDNPSIGGRVSGMPSALAFTPCGFTIDTTQKSQGVLVFNFDGTTVCNSRIRSGIIKVSLMDFLSGKRWRDAGAVLKLDFSGYKIKRTSDNKSLTFDGSSTVTNVEGGNWVTLFFALSPKLVNKVEATNLKVTFDDGKAATCNLSRKFTYTWSNNVLTAKGEGEGTYNGLNNLENWGVSKEGNNYTSQVLDPVVWNSTCGANKPTSGKLDVQVQDKEFSFAATFGVDQSGNVVTNSCPWGFKVEWKFKNKTGQKIYQYN
jgi:hypothetical protein